MSWLSFGKRQQSANCLDRILIPGGAAASADEWSLSEALHLFVTEACERALFTRDELPADALAVLGAYHVANELVEGYTIGGWLSERERPVILVAHGLRMIGAADLAELLEVAARAPRTEGEPSERSANPAALGPQRWESLISLCSQWVRQSPLTVVLGDGRLDTEYKQLMLQLCRCNAHYAERRQAEDERRTRLRLAPRPRIEGPATTLEQLIAEMRRLHG